MRPKGTVIAFLALGALYLLCLRVYFVGAFNDDAFYLLGARSLLSGRYADLSAPGSPPMVFYPPGTSLFLAPAALVAGRALWPFQLVSVALTLGCVKLWLSLFEGELQPRHLWLGAVLWAANPLTAALSGAVLSEPPFLLLLLLLLLLAKRRWASRQALDWFGLGLLAGGAFLVRATGAAVAAALVLALFRERRDEEGGCAMLGAMAAVLPWVLRNVLVSGQAEVRLFQLLDPYLRGRGAGALAGAVAENALFYGKTVFGAGFFPVTVLSLSLRPLELALGAVALALAAWGLWGRGLAGWRRLPALFLAFYALIHLLWPLPTGRYAHCVLPLAAAYFLFGAQEAAKRWRLKPWAVPALAGVCLALNLPGLWVLAGSGVGLTPPRSAAPERAYSWLRENTRPQDLLAAEVNGRVALRTGRRVILRPGDLAPAKLEGWMLKADYVLIEPACRVAIRPAGPVTGDFMDANVMLDIVSHSPRFKRVFADPSYGTEVYRVVPIQNDKMRAFR